MDKLTEQKCSVSFPCFCGVILPPHCVSFYAHFTLHFRTDFTPKIKYSSPQISTCEQTVEKRRKPRKIKGLRRFFSGKDRGKCESLTPFFVKF